MNTLVAEAKATNVHFDEDSIWVSLTDGRQLGVPLAYFPRLRQATAVQREKFIISGGGVGLHWEDLDEDISVKSLLAGVGDRHRQVA